MKCRNLKGVNKIDFEFNQRLRKHNFKIKHLQKTYWKDDCRDFISEVLHKT